MVIVSLVHFAVVVLQTNGLGPVRHALLHWGCLETNSSHLLLHLLPNTRNPEETRRTRLFQCGP